MKTLLVGCGSLPPVTILTGFVSPGGIGCVPELWTILVSCPIVFSSRCKLQIVHAAKQPQGIVPPPQSTVGNCGLGGRVVRGLRVIVEFDGHFLTVIRKRQV